MDIIEFENVSKYYDSRPALKNLSLQVEKGRKLVILGHSGCGKTTLLRLIAGFVLPSTGIIKIDGEIAAQHGKNVLEPEKRNLGIVFQDLALWPHMCVKGNLEFGLKARNVSKTDCRHRVTEMLELVHMEDYADAKPYNLSMGQQQRIAIARALALRPKILIMDEPLSSLDFELRYRISMEILNLQRQIGFTLIYITHNLDEAFTMADQIMVLKNGQLDRAGTVAEIKDYFSDLKQTMMEKYRDEPGS